MFDTFKDKLEKDKSLLLKIKVHPGAKANKMKEIMDDGVLKIDIKTVPEGGKANVELIKFLARELGVSKNNIKILTGETSRLKKILISYEK